MTDEEKWVNYIKYLNHPMPVGFYAYSKDAALWADAELTRLRAIVARCEDVEEMANVIIRLLIEDASSGRIANAVRDYLLGR